MKYIFALLSLLFLFCCRKDDADKQPVQQDCLISSYTTDTTASGYHYNFRYEGNKIIEIRLTYSGYFNNSPIEIINTVTYNADGKPDAIIPPSGNSYKTKYFYSSDGMSGSRITYSPMPFPSEKLDYLWQGDRIIKITRSDYEIMGASNVLENYTERLNYVLDLKYNEQGNVIFVKRTSFPDKLVTEIEYEYDAHPNPLKDLSRLRSLPYDAMYLLSANNMTRARYFFVKEQFSTSFNSPYQYNENGYPKNGAFNSGMRDIQYQCR